MLHLVYRFNKHFTVFSQLFNKNFNKMSISLEKQECPNIYEKPLIEDTICDLSGKNLEIIPDVKQNLHVLYLQNNKIAKLPGDFFPSLPSLMYLDMRDNCLTEIPTSIHNHPSLTHLLLQNNKLTSLPNELGTTKLKVLLITGNPLTYPPQEVLSRGISKIIDFLQNKFIDNVLAQNAFEGDSANGHYSDLSPDIRSYNSVMDADETKRGRTLSVQFSERDLDDETDYYGKVQGKCRRLAKSRDKIPIHSQSSKYIFPPTADNREVMNRKIRQKHFKEQALKKHKELMEAREKILQGRRNFELLRNWRRNYCLKQQFANSSYKMMAGDFPYDTSSEYMNLLTREDLEKDLPDKYKRNLFRRSKPTVPRKNNNDVHLALKIKQLFQNLDAIDLNKDGLTPRTEQKLLLSEIQKITEIKQKLSELSMTNGRSVAVD
ncbi:hypothetical protein ACJJTC_010934 [Scirpophaga incertulas]